jgi:hypothetical protein
MEGGLQLGDRISVRKVAGCNSVRDQGLDASEPHPLVEQSAITQAFGRNLFVVALQKNAFPSLPLRDQSIDRLARR